MDLIILGFVIVYLGVWCCFYGVYFLAEEVYASVIYCFLGFYFVNYYCDERREFIE